MQFYCFSLVCLLLTVRDTKHSPRDVQMDTRDETRLSWLHWSLLNFWFLNYCRPCLSYLLLSFLEGPRLHVFFFIPGVSVRYSACPVLRGLVLQTHFAWNSFRGEQQGQEFSRLGRVSECGALSCVLHSACCQEAALPGHYQNLCEYWHQAYNYPQVLLSRNHPLVVFYIALQHRVLRKPVSEFGDFEQSQGAFECSFHADSGMFCDSSLQTTAALSAFRPQKGWCAYR